MSSWFGPGIAVTVVITFGTQTRQKGQFPYVLIRRLVYMLF